MLLKLLLGLLPFFFMPDAGGSGGEGGEGGDDGDGGENPPEGHQGGEDQKAPPKNDSANKLIKDFVSQRGLTVEQLLQKITEQEDAEKTELQKVSGERDTYKTELEALRNDVRDSRAETTFIDAATKANARAPRTLFKALKGELQFDDDGNVTNLSAVIDKAKTDEPDLFKSGAGHADGGQKGEGTGTSLTMNQALREMAKP